MKRPMTPNGYAALQREVRKLKAMRPELSRAIEVARAHGDISENADYDAAKAKSGMVEAKIRDMEARLSVAEVIDPLKIANFNKVVFGLTVKIEDLESGEQKCLSIVGGEESDVTKGLISFESPLGRCLIGRAVGDVAKAQLPGGVREYEILEIFCCYKPEGNEPSQTGEEG